MTTEETMRLGKVARLTLLIENHGVDGALIIFNEALNNIIENAQQDNGNEFKSDDYADLCRVRDVIIMAIHAANSSDLPGSDVSLIGDSEEPATKSDGGIIEYISDVIFYKRNGFSFSRACDLADVAKKNRAERGAKELSE